MSQHLAPVAAVHEGGLIRDRRAEHILDAAAALLLRWGYPRITMEDIAREAGIGTGTLYLHWKTKAALFETVLLRELLALWSDLEQELHVDPDAVLLHRLLASLLRAIYRRPLARALFVRDAMLLGNLAHKHTVQPTQPLARADALLGMCRDLGLMRSDMPIDVQAHAFNAIWTGFVLVDAILPGHDSVSLDTQAAALSETIRRTFEPDALPPAEVLRDHVAPAFRLFLTQARQAIEQQIQARVLSPGR
jgi:AcrR family transcriptional regulator